MKKEKIQSQKNLQNLLENEEEKTFSKEKIDVISGNSKFDFRFYEENSEVEAEKIKGKIIDEGTETVAGNIRKRTIGIITRIL